MILKIDVGLGWWYLPDVTFLEVGKDTVAKKDIEDDFVVCERDVSEKFKKIHFYVGTEYWSYAIQSGYIMNDDGKTVEYIGI